MFDLDDDVVFELAVERMKIVVGSFGAVVFGIAPVEVMIVDESTIKHDAVMRIERARDNVGRVGGRAAIEGRAETAFGIGFDDEAAEVGNGRVNSVGFLAPPIRDSGIERIECVEASNGFGTGKINGNRKLNTPWTKDVGDTDELREVIVPQKPGIGVYVVDGAAVDTDRSEETGVSSRAGQIRADVAVFEEDGTTGVTAFDAAIEIVPLIDPTNGSIGLLELVEMRKR